MTKEKYKVGFIVCEKLKIWLNCRAQLFVLAILLWVPLCSYGQETKISGIISDASTGERLPFVNVIYKGTSIGTSSDVNGNFFLSVNVPPSDSVVISYMGYLAEKRFVRKGISQVINIALSPDIKNLEEVVVVAGKDPAYGILKKVIKNKKN